MCSCVLGGCKGPLGLADYHSFSFAVIHFLCPQVRIQLLANSRSFLVSFKFSNSYFVNLHSCSSVDIISCF